MRDRMRRLKYIALALGSLGHWGLRGKILGLLNWDVWDYEDPDDWLYNASLPRRYLFMMAVEVADAFAEGRLLRLGRLVPQDDTENDSLSKS